MIRRYCDICGRECESRTRIGSRIKRERYHAAGKSLQVEVMVALNKCWNSGDVCDLCILDAVANGIDCR